MSSPARSRQQGWPTPLYDLISTANAGVPDWDDDGVSLPISHALLSRLLPGMPELSASDLGIAMCFLPMDISLRAYAIDAIRGVVAKHGFEVVSRRDVPVRPEVLGDAAFTRPHVAQFFISGPDGVHVDALELQLRQLRAAIECELASLGMTSDDVQVISCSARTLTYMRIAGQDDLAALYPDLAELLDASFDARFQSGLQRRPKPA